MAEQVGAAVGLARDHAARFFDAGAETKRLAPQRQADAILRGVDYQLLHYGPRRALNALHGARLALPGDNGFGRREIAAYERVIAGMIRRSGETIKEVSADFAEERR